MEKQVFEMVRELLLGDNPFIGVSHLTQEKAREEAAENLLENKVKVIEAAVNGGATGFTFSTHESNLQLLAYLSTYREDLLNSMNYYILTPCAQSYVRKTNIEGTSKFMMSTLSNMVHKPSAILNVLTSLILSKPERLAGPLIEMELAPYLKILPKERIKAILLHEIVTELIVAFDLGDTLKALTKYMKDKIGFEIGLETRNLGHLHKWMIKEECSPEYLMVPANPLGYQMAPSKEATEKSIVELSERAKIIAINVLASGAVSLEEATSYLIRYADNLYAVTSASTNSCRIRQNFHTLSRMLSHDRVGTYCH
jgi:hypothetical protein